MGFPVNPYFFLNDSTSSSDILKSSKLNPLYITCTLGYPFRKKYCFQYWETTTSASMRRRTRSNQSSRTQKRGRVYQGKAEKSTWWRTTICLPRVLSNGSESAE